MSPPLIAAYLVAALYTVSGTLELANRRKLAPNFERWGYPRHWIVVTCLLKIAGGITVLPPSTRIAGLVLCLVIAIAGAGTILYHRDRAFYRTSLPVIGVILVLVGIACQAP